MHDLVKIASVIIRMPAPGRGILLINGKRTPAFRFTCREASSSRSFEGRDVKRYLPISPLVLEIADYIVPFDDFPVVYHARAFASISDVNSFFPEIYPSIS